MVRDRETDSLLPFMNQPFSVFPHGNTEVVGFSLSRFVNIAKFNHSDFLCAIKHSPFSKCLNGDLGYDIAVFATRIMYIYLFQLWFQGFSTYDPCKDRFHGSDHLACLDSEYYTSNIYNATYQHIFERFLFLFRNKLFPDKSSCPLVVGEKTPEKFVFLGYDFSSVSLGQNILCYS